jgi:phage-related protein
MALGLALSGAAGTVVPDKTMSRKSAPKVLLANFGDGYEQRVADGINTVKETYTLSFRNRPKLLIDDMIVQLDANKGVTALVFTIPDTNNTTTTGEKAIKVVCVDYSTNYEHDDFYSLSVNLRRVFEA